jgi:hypothetical protein
MKSPKAEHNARLRARRCGGCIGACRERSGAKVQTGKGLIGRAFWMVVRCALSATQEFRMETTAK